MVFDLPRSAVQKTPLKLEKHECFAGHIVVTADPKAHGRCKTKAWVIFRVTEDNGRTEPELFAPFQTNLHKRSANASSLKTRDNRQGCKSHNFQVRIPKEYNGGEHDMANDRGPLYRDEGDNWPRLFAQREDRLASADVPKAASFTALTADQSCSSSALIRMIAHGSSQYHHPIGWPSRKKPPLGPPGASVAAHTMPEAPCLTFRSALTPPMSVLTQPGQTELTMMPRELSSCASVRVSTLSAAFEAR